MHSPLPTHHPQIGFEDVFGLPEMRTRQPVTGVHDAMERALKL